MKNRISLLGIAVVTSMMLFSCQNESTPKTETKIEEEPQPDTIVELPTNNDTIKSLKEVVQIKPGDIEGFIKKFSTDSVYQVSHISFPVTDEYFDDSVSKELITEEQWKMVYLIYDSTAFYREFDRFEQNIKQNNDSLTIDFVGIDNGIYLGYNFILVDGEWTLIKKYDYSN